MLRSGLVSLLVLALAPSSEAATPLGPADHVAMSGDAAILAHAHGRTLTVIRTPLTGGPGTPLLEFKGKRLGVIGMDASAGRVAVLFADAKGSRVFAGPATGPLTELETRDPYAIDVVGDTVMVSAGDEVTAVAPDGTRSVVALPKTAQGVQFAGDFVSYVEIQGNEPEDEPGTHLRVRNWHTGAEVRALDLPDAEGVIDADLRDDGGLLLELDDGHVHTLLPGQDLRDLGDDPSRETGATHRWAGDGYTVRTTNRTAVFRRPAFVAADGTKTDFGLPSVAIEDLVSDGRTAVWQANGCAIAAPLTEPLTHTYSGTACKLAEVVVDGPYKKKLERRTPVRVHCLVAPGKACVGTVDSAKQRRRVSFRIPGGKAKTLHIVLTTKALHEAGRADGAAVRLRFQLEGGRPISSVYPVG